MHDENDVRTADLRRQSSPSSASGRSSASGTSGTSDTPGTPVAPPIPVLEHVVQPVDDYVTISHLLRVSLRLSQRIYRRLKREHGIFVNGTSARADTRVRVGDSVKLFAEPEPEGDSVPEPMNLNIAFEDAHLVVLNKPVGICVHPTHGHWFGTLANGLAHYFAAIGLQARVRPVHRLDQNTSGLVVFAKTQLAHQRMAEQLATKEMVRLYVAVALGHMPQPFGTITGAIDRSPTDRRERVVVESGRAAVTHFEVIRDLGCASELLLNLGTGRTHQIRVHLAHVGHPLVGDPMYMKECPEWVPTCAKVFPRQALHAGELRFRHPLTGEPVVLKADLPEDMAMLIRELASTEAGVKGVARPGIREGSTE